MMTRSVCARRSCAGAAALLAIVALGCGLAHDLSAQLSTARSMYLISQQLNDVIAKNDAFQVSDLEDILASQGGLDSWGNKLVMGTRVADGAFSYLLVSPGSDGKLDVDDVSIYFDLPAVDITGNYSHDIVLQDGLYVTVVSKEHNEAFPKRDLLQPAD